MKSKYNQCLQWLLIGVCSVQLSCGEKDDPIPPADDDNLVSATVTGSRSAAELRFLIQLLGRDIDTEVFAYDVDVYNVVYITTYQDTEIEASGLVILPKTSDAVPMMSYQRGTIIEQADAPSVQSKSSQEVISYTALASMGFITAVPDLIGFGESSALFHPYYIQEPTAAAVVDLLRAAAALAEEKGLNFNSELFLAGYSQGGYATLAAHKSLESESPDGFELIASFPGAGGYDVRALKEYFLTQETYDNPYYFAYIGMSYQSYYAEDDLIGDFFNDPYATLIPGLFNGQHSAGDIDAQLTGDVSALVKEDVIDGSNSTLTAFLHEKFNENSLVDWAPQAPVFLYHGQDDVTVPYQNSQRTYDALLSNGSSEADLHLITLPGDHNTAIEPYIVDVIKKLEELK